MRRKAEIPEVVGRSWAGAAVRLGVCGLLCAFAVSGADAAGPAASVPLAGFRAQIAEAQGLVGACGNAQSACSPAGLPPDEQVAVGSGNHTVSWQWLRDSLESAGKAKTNERADSMRAAAAHLVEWAAETDGGQDLPAAEFGRARGAANAALARDEFRATQQEPTWWDRQYARLQDLFLGALFGLDRLGRGAPWLAPLIEWSFFLLATAGLILFVRRTLERQALRIALGEGAATAGRTAQDVTDWSRLAREFADAQNWREAVHALYWAGISLLESRRAWRPNAARTPREYVRLLSPGSPSQRALRALTRSLEAVWYGRSEGDEAQYRAALGSFAELETASLTRAGARTDHGSSMDRRPLPGGA